MIGNRAGWRRYRNLARLLVRDAENRGGRDPDFTRDPDHALALGQRRPYRRLLLGGDPDSPDRPATFTFPLHADLRLLTKPDPLLRDQRSHGREQDIPPDLIVGRQQRLGETTKCDARRRQPLQDIGSPGEPFAAELPEAPGEHKIEAPLLRLFEQRPKPGAPRRFPARHIRRDVVDILLDDLVTDRRAPCPNEIGKAARFEKYYANSKAYRAVDPPEDVAGRIMNMPNEWPFPTLTGIIGTPTMRPDGSLLTEPGYDPATGYYLFNPPAMPNIPHAPSREEALECLYFLEEPAQGISICRPGVARGRPVGIDDTGIAPGIRRRGAIAYRHRAEGGSGKTYYLNCVSKVAIGECCPVIHLTNLRTLLNPRGIVRRSDRHHRLPPRIAL
jgi:hypothetical protein